MIRVLYELVCLKNPQDTLGLGRGEIIHIVPVSHMKEAAKRVVFQGISRKLHLSPFFKGRFKETLEEIRFPDKGIVIIGGGSNDNSALGLNVWSALADETNFMGKVRGGQVSAGGKASRLDKAQSVYDALRRRVKSRYAARGLKGMLFLASSKRSVHDFTERRIQEVIRENDSGVFIRDYATWDVRPNAFQGQSWHRAAVSQREGRVRLLTVDDVATKEEIEFKFPDEYLQEFKNDPEGAARDIAGIALESFRPFFPNRIAIEDMMRKDRPHPFHIFEWNAGRELKILWDQMMMQNAAGEPVPRCCSGALRHCHIDLSKNNDATGFCIGHQAGGVEVMRVDPETGEKHPEEVPFVHIDFCLRILPPHAGEIDHQLVRSLIYRLHEGGLPIRSVSADKWMGLTNLQLIKKRGFMVEEVSTQRTMEPFLAARSALHERRVLSPYYPFLAKELRELEIVETKSQNRLRVDHPPHGSKDVADAWAAVIYVLSQKAKAGTGTLTVSRGEKDKYPANQAFGPTPTGDGNWRWPDEERPDSSSESGGLPCWIIT